MKLHGQELEHLYFKFGFVMPNSENSWEQTIVADRESMVPAEILSGNLTVETHFLMKDTVVNKSHYRVFYE